MIRCISCGAEYGLDEIIYTCRECDSILEVVMEPDVSRDIFECRRNTMWKYKEFMPVDETRIISLQE